MAGSAGALSSISGAQGPRQRGKTVPAPAIISEGPDRGGVRRILPQALSARGDWPDHRRHRAWGQGAACWVDLQEGTRAPQQRRKQ